MVHWRWHQKFEDFVYYKGVWQHLLTGCTKDIPLTVLVGFHFRVAKLCPKMCPKMPPLKWVELDSKKGAFFKMSLQKMKHLLELSLHKQ